MRDIITSRLPIASERNYTTTKNKRKHPDRVEFKKYCPVLLQAYASQRDEIRQSLSIELFWGRRGFLCLNG